MDAGPLLLLGLAWLVISGIRKSGQTPPVKRPPTPRPGGAPRGDPSQREGQQLESLLRELERTLGRGAGPLGRLPDRPLPDEEEIEDRETLESMPRVESLESEPERAERETVDYDEEAEQIIARRRATADVHSARIRQEPADKTATRAPDPRRLRDAVVWREILGPPVSLRREEDGP